MTAQHPDMVTYRRRRYAVTAAEGDGLFDPAAYGVDPQPISTGCWRGTICHYAVRRDGLVLDRLDLGADGQPPDLAGAQPAFDGYSWRYARVGLPVAFTGRLLVGRGDVDDSPYLNMGFWPAWMYAEVHDLTFESGKLTTADDVSDAIAAVRREATAGPADGEETKDWISRTFSLTYSYSWPR